MRAMVLERQGEPLQERDLDIPQPGPNDVLIKVECCAVCRTDLHIVDGELPFPKLPLIPGHQVVGRVIERGEKVSGLENKQLVGVPWLGKVCGQCEYCKVGRENLCDQPTFTGYTRDGGFAEYMVADARFVFPLLETSSPQHIAPFLCAGLIGFRAFRMTYDIGPLGIYGFGSAAHIITQIAVKQRRRVFAFTRPGDKAAQEFARYLGAVWAGDSDSPPPEPLGAAIIFAPVGPLVPECLRHLKKGGILITAGIHMSDIPSFPYQLLWEERTIRSVANLTRLDGEEFLSLVQHFPIKTTVVTYGLEEANRALDDLRSGRLTGTAVLLT